MEIDRYDNGVPSWVDVTAEDAVGLAAFYGSLFGWDAPEGPAEFGGYRVCTLRGRTVAGINPMTRGGPPAWLSYVSVDDADAVSARVDGLGGKVLAGPMDVGESGRMAILADDVGAVIGLWQPGQHPGAGLVNEPGAFCWSELVTTDVGASSAFYDGLFGWKANRVDDGIEYHELKIGDRPIGGMMPKLEDMPASLPAHWAVYFAVEDCDAAVDEATALGAAVWVTPRDIMPGRFAVLSDPAGASFSVIAFRPHEHSASS